MNKIYKGLKWFGNELKEGFPATIGVNIEATPVYAAAETLAGMTNQASINTRIGAATTFMAGMGVLWNSGRNLSQKVFKIDTTDPKAMKKHDRLYSAGFNAVFCPVLYIVSGEDSLTAMGLGTLFASGLGYGTGDWQGYAADVGMDMLGVKEAKRPAYNKLSKNWGKTTKKAALIGAAATSVALTAGLYKATPDEGLWRHLFGKDKGGIEQIVEAEETTQVQEGIKYDFNAK